MLKNLFIAAFLCTTLSCAPISQKDESFKFKIGEKVCLLEKYDGIILHREWYKSGILYAVWYATPVCGVKSDYYNEILLSSGHCEKTE